MRNLSGDECSHTDVSHEVFERVLRERDKAREALAELHEQLETDTWAAYGIRMGRQRDQALRERDEAREALRETFYLNDVDFEFYAKRWPWLINTSCGHPPKSARCDQCLPWEKK